ncbi:hypothetical protein AC578_5897 [Pseudocercospora eumusae]|uniref:Uncharacterized protein n=1 Tax=Pseudocercospora eumusae TaxID=321146 RepID=A0A139HBI6_9PEZI|nr:hypothetical protein AC578_5897 [Pseudocercospora eumusae]
MPKNVPSKHGDWPKVASGFLTPSFRHYATLLNTDYAWRTCLVIKTGRKKCSCVRSTRHFADFWWAVDKLDRCVQKGDAQEVMEGIVGLVTASLCNFHRCPPEDLSRQPWISATISSIVGKLPAINGLASQTPFAIDGIAQGSGTNSRSSSPEPASHLDQEDLPDAPEDDHLPGLGSNSGSSISEPASHLDQEVLPDVPKDNYLPGLDSSEPASDHGQEVLPVGPTDDQHLFGLDLLGAVGNAGKENDTDRGLATDLDLNDPTAVDTCLWCSTVIGPGVSHSQDCLFAENNMEVVDGQVSFNDNQRLVADPSGPVSDLDLMAAGMCCWCLVMFDSGLPHAQDCPCASINPDVEVGDGQADPSGTKNDLDLIAAGMCCWCFVMFDSGLPHAQDCPCASVSPDVEAADGQVSFNNNQPLASSSNTQTADGQVASNANPSNANQSADLGDTGPTAALNTNTALHDLFGEMSPRNYNHDAPFAAGALDVAIPNVASQRHGDDMLPQSVDGALPDSGPANSQKDEQDFGVESKGAGSDVGEFVAGTDMTGNVEPSLDVIDWASWIENEQWLVV